MMPRYYYELPNGSEYFVVMDRKKLVPCEPFDEVCRCKCRDMAERIVRALNADLGLRTKGLPF